MKFARYVFAAAGVWGIAVLTPLFFLRDITGRSYPMPVDYPHFFYGFIAVALAWQGAFLLIASDPARFRMMMIPAFLEKGGYVAGTLLLYSQGRISIDDANAAFPDAVLLALFVVAFVKARPERQPR